MNKVQSILTSSIADTGESIARELEKPANEYNLLFVTTASEGISGDLSWLDNDRNALIKAGFNVTDYTITGKSRDELELALNNIDILFVNGGNTFYLLDQIQKTGFDKLINNFIKNGGIYGSSSAGSVVAGIDIEPSRKIEDKELVPELKSTKGLGLINFVILPHWGSGYFKDLYLNRRLEHAYKKEFPILLLDDNSYVVVREGQIAISRK